MLMFLPDRVFLGASLTVIIDFGPLPVGQFLADLLIIAPHIVHELGAIIANGNLTQNRMIPRLCCFFVAHQKPFTVILDRMTHFAAGFLSLGGSGIARSEAMTSIFC
jgi:hypothetical protein